MSTATRSAVNEWFEPTFIRRKHRARGYLERSGDRVNPVKRDTGEVADRRTAPLWSPFIEKCPAQGYLPRFLFNLSADESVPEVR